MRYATDISYALLWRAITQDQEEIFHKGADILIERNLYMKKKLPSAVITKERITISN